MNFLAHFHLAWPEELLVVGGLEGDYHKGPLPGGLARPLLAGVRLHRAVDAYTDRHPALASARQLFPPPARRYAGILLDLSFDHFLAQHWRRFSDHSLARFSGEIYRMLDAHEDKLSPAARRMAGRLAEFDLLGRYREWDTVLAAAGRIGERLRHPNPLDRAGDFLEPLAPELERVFLVFYPELQEFCQRGAMLPDPENKD